jgi:hypothetical protein
VLVRVRPMVSPTLPTLTGFSLDGRLIIPADVSSLSFRGGKLSAHEGDRTGDMKVNLGSAVSLDAQLRSTRLDMDALLKAFGVSMASTPTGSAVGGNRAEPVVPAAPLPWAVLRGPMLDLKATIATMTFQQQDWQNVELTLQLRGGVLKVDRLSLGPPGGPLTSSNLKR